MPVSLNLRELAEQLRRTGGILKLRPEFVHRFYPDLNRLGQHRRGRSPRQFIPERWIGSSIQAANPKWIPGGGLSMLADSRAAMSLRDAITMTPLEMLGERIAAAHGAEFRVLVKVLDPGEPIVFHFHPTDAQVQRMPRHFRGQRFGKDEAYYFLDAPKGPTPYTHAGLRRGVTRRELIDAIKRGPRCALELSPGFHQQYETGFFVPAGVPHRPGTALTLEIQQPSDADALLETSAGGKRLSRGQIHPGFASLDEAVDLIDLPLSKKVGRLKANRLTPSVISTSPAGEVATIFPPEICRKLAGRRIRVARELTYREAAPLVLFIWKGRGRVNGRSFRAGDEFFVTHDTASRGLELSSAGDDVVEAFTFFPQVHRRR